MKSINYYIENGHEFCLFDTWIRFNPEEKIKMIENTALYFFFIKCIKCLVLLIFVHFLINGTLATSPVQFVESCILFFLAINAFLLNLGLQKCNIEMFFEDVKKVKLHLDSVGVFRDISKPALEQVLIKQAKIVKNSQILCESNIFSPDSYNIFPTDSWLGRLKMCGEDLARYDKMEEDFCSFFDSFKTRSEYEVM